MKTSSYSCDACGKPADHARSRLRWLVGPHRHDAPLDLCRWCARELLDWLADRQAHRAESPQTVPTPGAPPRG